jgi:hypothetical protein
MIESTQTARDLPCGQPAQEAKVPVARVCSGEMRLEPVLVATPTGTAAHSRWTAQHHSASDDASSRTGGTLDASSRLLLPAGRLHVFFVVLTGSGKVLVLSSCRQRTT